MWCLNTSTMKKWNRLHHSVPCFQLCSVLLQSYLNPWQFNTHWLLFQSNDHRLIQAITIGLSPFWYSLSSAKYCKHETSALRAWELSDASAQSSATQLAGLARKLEHPLQTSDPGHSPSKSFDIFDIQRKPCLASGKSVEHRILGEVLWYDISSCCEADCTKARHSSSAASCLSHVNVSTCPCIQVCTDTQDAHMSKMGKMTTWGHLASPRDYNTITDSERIVPDGF